MTTRRDFLRRTSVGAAAVGVLGIPAFGAAQGAPTRAPVKLTFWTWENPQQRPWLKKRIDQYTQQYPNVYVEFQYFAFSDLGKKISIGYATGTAPDGYTSRRLAHAHVAGRASSSCHSTCSSWVTPPTTRSVTTTRRRSWRAPSTRARSYGYPLWFYGVLQPRQHQAVQGGRPRPRQGRAARRGNSSARSPSG